MEDRDISVREFFKKEDTSFWNISDTWQDRNITIYRQNTCIGEIWYLARLGRRPVVFQKHILFCMLWQSQNNTGMEYKFKQVGRSGWF